MCGVYCVCACGTCEYVLFYVFVCMCGCVCACVSVVCVCVCLCVLCVCVIRVLCVYGQMWECARTGMSLSVVGFLCGYCMCGYAACGVNICVSVQPLRHHVQAIPAILNNPRPLAECPGCRRQASSVSPGTSLHVVCVSFSCCSAAVCGQGCMCASLCFDVSSATIAMFVVSLL